MILTHAIRALRFDDEAQPLPDRVLRDSRFEALANQSHLTLPLALRGIPVWLPVRDRNRLRLERAVDQCRELHQSLTTAGIDHIFLKGLTQWPWYAADPLDRPQYDIDIYCPEHTAAHAWRHIQGLGYQPLHALTDARADHLPPLIRPTSWQWRGDYFDPEMPFIVEIHHRFWDPAGEAFDLAGSDVFWSGRTTRANPLVTLPAMDAVSQLRYSTWHLVRHLLRGDLRLSHVYELAHFLHRSAAETDFWRGWMLGERNIEGIAFRLAHQWFGCDLHPAVAQTMVSPPAIDRWFRLFANSPITRYERPNKDYLFLHACLANGVMWKRLFPSARPRQHLNSSSAQKASFALARSAHHARALFSWSRSAARWWLSSASQTSR